MTPVTLNKPSESVPLYRSSFFNLSPVPEFATGENLAASLYRSVGFKFSEGRVPELGKKFKEKLGAGILAPPNFLPNEAYREVVESLLSSPRQPGQQKEWVATLVPLVPSISLFSGSARQTGNPWNPGELVARMVEFGCGDQPLSNDIWKKIFLALDASGKSDLYASWVDDLFKACRPPGNPDIGWTPPDGVSLEWEFQEFEPKFPVDWSQWPSRGPSVRFVEDLKRVLELKTVTTRRQWVSLLESFLRISCSAHVAWICKSNEALWKYLVGCFEITPSDDLSTVKKILSGNNPTWSYGEKIMPQVNQLCRTFASARTGINLLLLACEKVAGSHWPGQVTLNTPEGILALGRFIHENKVELNLPNIKNDLMALLEKDPGFLACENGITRNLSFFFRYTLGQRQSLSEEQKSYDQGFWAKKAAPHKSAPWVISAGPVSLMVMVACCAGRRTSPRTIEDFSKFLATYGLVVTPRDMAWNGLGDSLRMLGLVVDSPDAEGGMVIQDPFAGF